MVNIQIDIWPHGDKAKKRKIANIKIANVSGRPCMVDTYRCHISNEKKTEIFVKHIRKEGIYILLKKVLEEYEKSL